MLPAAALYTATNRLYLAYRRAADMVGGYYAACLLFVLIYFYWIGRGLLFIYWSLYRAAHTQTDVDVDRGS